MSDLSSDPIFKNYLANRNKSPDSILRTYEYSGYLGKKVGSVVKIELATEWRCFLRFSWRSFVGSVVPGVIGLITVIWVWREKGAWSGCIAFLSAYLAHAFFRAAFDADDAWCFSTDTESMDGCVIVGGFPPWFRVLTAERVSVGYDSEPRAFSTHKRLLRRPTSGGDYELLKIGDIVSEYNGQILYPTDAKKAADDLRTMMRREAKIRDDLTKSNAKRMEEAAAKYAEKQAVVRAEMAKNERLSHCRLDNWQPEPTEPFIRHLPSCWLPFTTVGLAYANVVAYGSSPATQRYDPNHQRWETVGMQTAGIRGIYLIGTNSQRTFNRIALAVGPHRLPGTTSQDLVMFVLDQVGAVKFLGNPARWEIYEDTQGDEEEKKLAMLRPVLTKLYERVLSAGPGSSGWA